MINIAIVDDEKEARARLRGCISYLETKVEERFRVDEFESAAHFFMHFDNQYNIVFLDIEIPEMDGMTAARRLRELDKTVTIIFVTNTARYAVQGYEVDALDYIVKKTIEYKLGARGLRSIVETIMNDAMFEIPSKKVKRYTVKLEYAKEQMAKSQNLNPQAIKLAS